MALFDVMFGVSHRTMMNFATVCQLQKHRSDYSHEVGIVLSDQR